MLFSPLWWHVRRRGLLKNPTLVSDCRQEEVIARKFKFGKPEAIVTFGKKNGLQNPFNPMMKDLLNHVQFKKEAIWILCGLFFLLILVNWPQGSANESTNEAQPSTPTQQPSTQAAPIDSVALKQAKKEAKLQFRQAIVSSIRQAGHPCEKFSHISTVDAALEIYKVKCSDTATYRLQFDHGTQGWLVLERIFQQVGPTQSEQAQTTVDSLDLMQVEP